MTETGRHACCVAQRSLAIVLLATSALHHGASAAPLTEAQRQDIFRRIEKREKPYMTPCRANSAGTFSDRLGVCESEIASLRHEVDEFISSSKSSRDVTGHLSHVKTEILDDEIAIFVLKKRMGLNPEFPSDYVGRLTDIKRPRKSSMLMAAMVAKPSRRIEVEGTRLKVPSKQGLE